MKASWVTVSLAAALLVSGQAYADLGLAKKSGCMACHSLEKKVVGPAWNAVAEKYKGTADGRSIIISKIKSGGKGNWGAVPMPAYSPRVSDADIEKLADYILSL